MRGIFFSCSFRACSSIVGIWFADTIAAQSVSSTYSILESDASSIAPA